MSELKSILDGTNHLTDIAEETISELEYTEQKFSKSNTEKKGWKEMNRAAVSYGTTSDCKIHL